MTSRSQQNNQSHFYQQSHGEMAYLSLYLIYPESQELVAMSSLEFQPLKIGETRKITKGF